jgi:serine/threonine-protein kinase RsbW
MTTAAPANVELRIPRRPEYVRVARMAACALAAQLDFTFDLVKDIELAVGEACTNAVEHVAKEACSEVLLRFSVLEDRLTIEVIDHGQGFDAQRVLNGDAEEGEGGLGLQVIRAVMDELDVQCGQGVGTCVRMVKYRARS